MITFLTVGPLVASLFLARAGSIDMCLWSAVALCAGLAAGTRTSHRNMFGALAGGTAALLGSLALVTPTP